MTGLQTAEAQPAYVPDHIWRLAGSTLPEERAVWLTQSQAGHWMVWPAAADPVADRLAGYWQGQANAAPVYLSRSATSQDWPVRKVLINR